MTNTYDEDETLSVVGCDTKVLKCARCVWGYVFGHLPTDASCGKYKFKPKSVYFRGGECPRFEELKDIPEGE